MDIPVIPQGRAGRKAGNTAGKVGGLIIVQMVSCLKRGEVSRKRRRRSGRIAAQAGCTAFSEAGGVGGPNSGWQKTR